MLNYIQKSIDRRITFSVGLIITLSILCIGFFVYRFAYDAVTKELKETTLLRTQAISAEVEDLFENGSIVTEQLSYHNEIKTYLNEVDTRADIYAHPLYPLVRSALVEIKENSEYFSTIWISNDRANFYFDDIGNRSDATYETQKRPWYEVASTNHGVVFTPPYIEWNTGDTVLSAIIALRDVSRVYGFVAVDIPLDSIPKIFYKNRLGYGELFYLVSNEGYYIYHPDNNQIMNTSIFKASDLLSPFSDIVVQGGGSFEEVSVDGSHKLLLSYPVALANWRVVTLIDKKVLYSEIRNLFIILFMLMFVTLLVSTFVVKNVVKKQMRPIADLVDFGHNITDGALDQNIPVRYIQRQDEMGDLSRSFQLIIDAFRNENAYLEDKLEEKNDALRKQYDYVLASEKSASLGRLVAGISHEINTPLGNSVASLSYLSKISNVTKERLIEGALSREGLIDYIEEVDKSLGLMENNLLRSVELVENFKEVAVHSKEEPLEVVRINKVISMVTMSLKQEIKDGDHHVQSNCPDDFEFKSYSSAWIRIFSNLMLNSIHHGYKNIRGGKIDIEAYEKDDMIRVLYKDNGLGMSREMIKNVYEPFYTTARNQGNVGLGMAIVFNLVNQKLDGTIKLSSTPNHGLTVLIQVPKK